MGIQLKEANSMEEVQHFKIIQDNGGKIFSQIAMESQIFNAKAILNGITIKHEIIRTDNNFVHRINYVFLQCFNRPSIAAVRRNY